MDVWATLARAPASSVPDDGLRYTVHAANGSPSTQILEQAAVEASSGMDVRLRILARQYLWEPGLA